MIHLKGLPMPPSVNESYKIIHVPSRSKNPTRRGKKVATLGAAPALAQFKANCGRYFHKRRHETIQNKAEVTKWVESGLWLKVQIVLILPEEKMFFKNGKPRRWDVTRNKPVEDAISKHLGFDDCLLKECHITKIIGPELSCDVTLSPVS